MIKTWQQRCEEHPDHDGIVTERMIQARMQEEIDELRAAIPLMSIDVMKQALAVLDDYEPNEAHKVATALRAAIPHSEDCWRWHHECAAIRMERIFNEP